jgi:cholesterol transport system auxiliary component
VSRLPLPEGAALALALALCACGGTLFQSKTPPPTVYLLSAHGTTKRAAVAADLIILRPRVRAGLNTDRIAALYPDRRLDYYAGARWGGALDEVVQDLTLQCFHAHANLRSVSSDRSLFSRGYWLEFEVADFQAEYSAGGSAAPTIRVRLLGSIGAAADRRVLGRFEASAAQVAAENRMGPIVAAYEHAADEALDQLVDFATQTLLAGNLESR